MNHFMRCARALTTRIVTAIVVVAAGSMSPAMAAVPGITSTDGSATGTTAHFNLVAGDGYSSQPDGAQIYSWGYGCAPTTTPTYAPATTPQAPITAKCPLMQLPGPTLIVREGTTVIVQLQNNLPVVAGNTSIVFAGMTVTASGGVTSPGGQPGSAVHEAANGGGTVTYTFSATKPGTYSYYSGSQSDLQIEMGLFGAIIVTPKTVTGCSHVGSAAPYYVLAGAAYDDPQPGQANLTCYDREYLFQFSEMDSAIHKAAELQKNSTSPIVIQTEPYTPNYYLINGRSMPDDMDMPYQPAYASQPYNANPQVHPGERMLMRMIGQGRWQHPFHFHANHARELARDANPLLALDSSGNYQLAGKLLFTWGTVPGQTVDTLFTWNGQGLNWDAYGPQSTSHSSCNGVAYAAAVLNIKSVTDPTQTTVGLQLAGLNTATPAYTTPFDPTTHEYCPDHGKSIPAMLPDPQIVANGAWYSGSPYLGVQGSATNNLPPGVLTLNASGYAYMWHSHNEREITTNDVFPGGLMTMLIIQPLNVTIYELN